MRGELQPGYKQTEVGVIPEDWEVIPIGKAGQVLGGRQRSPHYMGGLCKYLRVANVFDGFIDTDDVLEMPFSAAEKERFLLKDGDILLNEGQSIELVGRSAIYRGTPEDCCFQNTLVRFRAGASVYPEFVQLVFQQYLRTGVFASIALQTTSIAHLGARRLVALKMPLPTKAEQEAIAKALSDADALIESLEQLIAKKRQVKQGAMQELLTGKKRLPGFTTKPGYKQTEVGVIPKEWEIRPLGDLVTFLDGKRQPVKDADRAKMQGSIPYYGASGIVDYVNDYLFDEELILLGEDGENILSRNCRLAFRISGKAWVNNHAHVLRPNPDVSIGFLTDYLESLNYERFNSGTAQPKLNKQMCFRLPVALPPTKVEQTAIAAILSDMDTEITALEAKLAKARQLKQGMMQELLTGKTRLVDGRKLKMENEK